MRIVTISEGLAGLTLATAIKSAHGPIPVSLLSKLTRKGVIRINGKRCKPQTIVELHDTIKLPELSQNTVLTTSYTVSKKELEEFKKLIIFENDYLYVLNKPEGLAVQGGTKLQKHVDGYLNAWADELEYRPHVIHRLDKGTSGILLIAKNPSSASYLSSIIQNKGMRKTYIALVIGKPDLDEGIIDLPLTKTMKGSFEKVRTEGSDLKQAITYYKVLTSDSKLSILELKPITGRTHQLRAHCSYGLKTPILGDSKYGGNAEGIVTKKDGFFLHAYQLEIVDISLKVQADIPIKFFSHINNLEAVL